MSSTINPTQKNSITIIAVVHNDVPKSKRETIYADHFYPLVKELQNFTERKVHVVFAGGEPYTHFDYKGTDTLNTLRRWESLGFRLQDEMRKEGLTTNVLTKVILVTNDLLDAGIAGVALTWPPTNAGMFAIASLTSYMNVGHEIGHLLGARHEDWEVQFNGWWAETYMTPQRELVRSISYTFSAANRKNINNYLSTKP
ncbi:MULTISPECIES: zinc-dependent metalloprotease [unclassified Pseudomonas]|jgi:hypothetical protein|uniref:zinc-dependent metalloprotease n=1 Tax=unclassified Pseudomonas TaxID=196821 RepID=UPI001CBE982C|nr:MULTISPECIES: zinc-dependent metalloprotease [unclassified Pseudomonas]